MAYSLYKIGLCLLFGVAIVASTGANSVHSEQCFCPLDIYSAIRVFKEPNIAANFTTMTISNNRVKGHVHSDWIKVDGERGYVQTSQLSVCGCQADSDVPPLWEPWSLWSTCSQTCNSGLRMRMRNCTLHCTELYQIENNTCFDNGCDVKWTHWQSWGACSKSCGGGFHTRYRQCTDGMKVLEVAACPFSLINPTGFYQIGACNTDECITVAWSEWSDCSHADNTPCGNGLSFRFRNCSDNNCSSAYERRHCYTPCPGEWSEWSKCAPVNSSCGPGLTFRFRHCKNITCMSSFERSDCYTPCPGRWSDWEEWSQCDASCGMGTRRRARDCNTTASLDGYSDLNCTGIDYDNQPCNTFHCPIDGQFSDWSEWTTCSVTCGGGGKVRQRHCDSPLPQYGGQNCIGHATEQMVCSTDVCPRDGGWATWDDWSECSATCDRGIRIRERWCVDPTPLGTGLNCTGSSRDISSCQLQHCSVNGAWSEWISWSNCSCENQQSRTRQCNNPSPIGEGRDCFGEAVENVTCIHHEANCPVNGSWSEWLLWNPCSVTCGHGSQQRFRTCTNPKPAHGGDYCPGDVSETQDCHEPICSATCDDDPSGDCGSPGVLAFVCKHYDTAERYCKRSCGLCPKVDGGWSAWSAWGLCSVTCENGTRERNRKCNHPAPAYGGTDCAGNSRDTRNCSVARMCPIDGEWTGWSAWSTCPVTCDNGTMTRSRTCSNPAPQYGGLMCSGSATDRNNCLMTRCPVDGGWTDWSAWSACPVTCDNGAIRRSRNCSNPAPHFGGLMCGGSANESSICSLAKCPVPCEDDPSSNCGDPIVLAFICKHNDTAEKYCTRSCGLCLEPRTGTASSRARHIKECPRLPAYVNAHMSDYDTIVGSVMKIDCLPGYQQLGSRVRICQADGTWSGTHDTCHSIH